jgi:hypothetical protein
LPTGALSHFGAIDVRPEPLSGVCVSVKTTPPFSSSAAQPRAIRYRSKFYRERGVSGLLETSLGKSLASDEPLKPNPIRRPGGQSPTPGFLFSDPNIFRFAVIAKTFFVRDDRHADGRRSVFGFSFFRHLANRKGRPSICWSAGVFRDISTENVLEIDFSDQY